MDYPAFATSIAAMLARFGADAALRRTETVGGDPWDPGSGTQTDVDYPVTAVVTSYRTDEIDGTVIEARDRRVYLSPDGLAIEPQTSDTLIIDGAPFAIVNVERMEPADATVAWRLQARG